MGIVTWASLKCELVPTVHKLTFVASAELADLVPLVYRLNRVRLGDEVLVLDRAYLARLLGALGCGLVAGELPPWTLIVGLGGREHLAAERVEVAENDARSIAEQAGLTVRLELRGAPTSSVQAALSSCCETPWKLAAKGGSADVFFLTTLDQASGFIETAREVAVSLGFTSADVGVYIQPQHQGVSHHVELSLPYDPSDAAEVAKAREFHDMAGERLIASGAYFSRPYGSWSRPVYRRDAASREALCKAKRIFDPLGIMNPGKLCFGALAVREEVLLMALTDFRADALRCTRCSYCKWIPFDLVKSHRFAKGCPSIEAHGFHAYSAGGRLVTMLSLMDDRSEITDTVVDIAFKCQLCGNCDVACKMCRYDMEPLAALHELRAHLVEQGRAPDSYRPIIERVRSGTAGKGLSAGRAQRLGGGARTQGPEHREGGRRLLPGLHVLTR